MNQSSTNKKRGNLFQANQSQLSNFSQKSQKPQNQTANQTKQTSKSKTGTTSKQQNEDKDKMNASITSKSSITNQQQNLTSKYEQKVMNIDLSQLSNTTGNSNGKRLNLFNEKSTSRERILTRKTVQVGYDDRQQQNDIDSQNTPSFNIKIDKKNYINKKSDSNNLQNLEEERKISKNQEQILQDFPFLRAQQQTSQQLMYNLSLPNIFKAIGGMNDDDNSEEEKDIDNIQAQSTHNIINQQDYFNPFNKKSQPNFMNMSQTPQGFAGGHNTRNQNNHGIGPSFFDGIDTVSQSQVSYSPKFNNGNTRRDESQTNFHPDNQGYLSNQNIDSIYKQYENNEIGNITSQKYLVRNNLDLNLSEMDPNGDTKSFMTAMGSQNVMHRNYQSGKKSQMTISRNMNLNNDNTSYQDEFLSAIQGDETLILDDQPRNTYQNQNSQIIIPDHLQLSRIDHRNDGVTSLDDLLGGGFGHTGFNRKEERVKTQILQYILDMVLYEQVIPNMIQETAKSCILNYSNLNKSNQMLIQQKSDELFNNELLPSVLVKFINEFMNVTDGSQAADKALKKYIDENIIENVNFILCSEIWNDCLLIPHVMKEDPIIFLSNMFDLMIKEVAIEVLQKGIQNTDEEKLEKISGAQIYQVRGKKEKANSSQFSQFSSDFEILKYVEDNLVQNFVISEVEDIVINLMQEIHFKNKKVPQIISEEIYDEILQDQMRISVSQVIKKERLLVKGADNFFTLFIQSEMGDVILEAIQQTQKSPLQIADQAVSSIQDILIQQMLKEQGLKAQDQIIQKKIGEQMIDLQLDKMLSSIAMVTISQLKTDTQIAQKVTDTLIQDVVYNSISDIIIHSMREEKKLHSESDNLIGKLLFNQVRDVALDTINDEIAQEEYDGIIDKIIEFDIWRDTVKDLKLEEEAVYALLEDWTDAFTGEFFIDHFTEIKNEYLKGYKEQITKLENSQIISQTPLIQQNQTQNFQIIRKNNDPYQVQSLNTSQRIDQMNNTKFFDAQSQSAYKAVNQSKMTSYKGASAVGRKLSSANSHNNQFLNNTSQFQSVNSDGFYDCNNGGALIDLDEQDIIRDFELKRLQQEMNQNQVFTYGSGPNDNSIIQLNKIKNDFEFNEELEFQMERQSDYSQGFIKDQHQVNYLKDPTFETQIDIMDETLQNLEIDEGTTRSLHHSNFYIIPEIKSLDFLNIRQTNFHKYFQPTEIMPKYQRNQTKKVTSNVLPIDALAIDVLCVNCYECVKFDEVDSHSLDCLKNQEALQSSKIRSPDKKSLLNQQMYSSIKQSSTFKESNEYPLDLNAYLNQDDMLGDMLDLERSYNFQEGNYILNQQKSDEQLYKIKEEREYISELNERIFKIHKAIKEKQIEEQHLLRQTKSNDMNMIRHLDNLESLAMSIFTNNTNIRELEMNGSDLIDKTRGFKPGSIRELNIQITSKRLQQLTLEKIQSLKSFNELMGYKEEEPYELYSQGDEVQINLTEQNYDDEFIERHPPPRSFSQSPDPKYRANQDHFFKSPQPKTDQLNLISEDQYRYLDEEQKKQKAELEVWRNLHNEILKNYLMTKGPLAQNKQINEISSDVSSKHEQISDNTSQFSSNTGGGASSLGSLFNNNFQYSKSINSTPAQRQGTFSPHNNLNDANEQDLGLLQEVEESLKFKESEDLKRHFYTLAIHNSKKILKSVPQGSILKNLYNKCKDLKIDVADWETFIQREFKYLRSSVQLH